MLEYFSGLALFGVQIHQRSTVYLCDNIGTDIPKDLFEFVIKNFWNGSNFFVEIKYAVVQNNNNIDLVTPEVRYIFHLILLMF